MTRCVLALDQGTTSSRAILFDRRGRASPRPRRSSASIIRGPGWVEHDPADLWDTTRRAALAVLGRPGWAGATSRPSASPTSGRRRCSGTGRPAGRSTGRSCGRTGAPPRRAPPSSAGASAPSSGGGRAPPRPVFLRHETRVAPRPRPRRAAPRRARRARLRHGRHVAPLEADGRPRARDRRLERVPHAPRRPEDGRLGRRLAGLLRVPMEVLPEIRPSSGVFGEIDGIPAPCAACPSRGSPATSRPRFSGRDASRPGWPRTPTGPGASCS
jgi:glycerol kinase